MSRRAFRPTKAILLLLTVVVGWLTLAPTQLGGPNTILVTSGVSMEPRFHSGDLAVVRRATGYQAGDIVGYHLTPQTVVLHRIVGEDGGRYVMKGDNNSWLDATQPEADQVVGKLWLHLPAIGALLVHLHSPVIVTILMVVVAGTMVVGNHGRRPATERRRKRAVHIPARWSQRFAASQLEEAMGIAIAVALIGLVAAVFAFSRPAQHVVAAGVPYTQNGTFTYSGAAAGGSIYANDQVSTGDPVYLQLVHSLQVGFDYRLAAAAAHSVHGTSSILLTIGQDTGWKRVVELLPETPFQGDTVAMTGTVPLDQIQSLATVFAEQTGLKGGSYTVDITPMISTEGTLAGAPLREQFAPALRFRMDNYQLVLDRPADQSDPLKPVQSGMLPRTREEADRFSLLGVSLAVPAARVLALLIVGLGLAAATGLSWLTARARGADEPTQIEARYHALLLEVRVGDGTGTEQGPVVDVVRIEDLAKLASQTGRMILHEQEGREHRYLVPDGGVVYRYCTVA